MPDEGEVPQTAPPIAAQRRKSRFEEATPFDVCYRELKNFALRAIAKEGLVT